MAAGLVLILFIAYQLTLLPLVTAPSLVALGANDLVAGFSGFVPGKPISIPQLSIVYLSYMLVTAPILGLTIGSITKWFLQTDCKTKSKQVRHWSG